MHCKFLNKETRADMSDNKKNTEKMCGPLLVCPADVFIIQTLKINNEY